MSNEKEKLNRAEIAIHEAQFSVCRLTEAEIGALATELHVPSPLLSSLASILRAIYAYETGATKI